MQFETIFDVAQAGYKEWWFTAIGLILTIIHYLMIFKPELILKRIDPALQEKFRKQIAKRPLSLRFGLGFCILFTVGTFIGTYAEYRDSKHALATNQYEIVEGVVQDFFPHSKEECFTVNGTPFCYSDFKSTSGFNHTAPYGGPIRKGLYVRVAYRRFYTGNEIIRLEVAKNPPNLSAPQ